MIEATVDPAFYAAWTRTLDEALSRIPDRAERDRFADRLIDLATRWRDRATESAIEVTLASHCQFRLAVRDTSQLPAKEPVSGPEPPPAAA